MVNKIGVAIVMFLIGLLLFFNLNLFSGLNNTDNNLIDKINIHNGKLISDILSENNYDLVGINPDKYDTFEGFLEDFKSFTGVLVKPLTDKIVIGLDYSSGSKIYIPFDFKNSGEIFDDKVNKNLAILDIYNAYKQGGIYGGVDSSYGNRILFEKDMQHPKTNIINTISTVDLSDQSNNVYKIMDSLANSKNLGISNKELLAYLYDFTGNYKEGEESRNELCKSSKNFCENKINVNLIGQVKDSKGRGIGGINVTLLNDSKYKVETDDNGYYKINFKSYNFSHLRIKASSEGYSDGFATYSLNNTFLKNINLNIDIDVSKADNVININESNKTDYIKGKYYIIEDKNSKYFIPRDGLYYLNGDRYEGNNILVYTYLFTKTTSSESMLANDTFDPVYGYVGNIMKTFGMPYIQFIDKDSKKELFIKSSNPMILQNKIYHMKELYDNHDKIYEAVTDDDMNFLVKTSKELGGYPIDFNFLTENGLLRWPVWWVLDRKTGTWGSIGSAVLNVDGLVELPFYSIKDN